MKFYSPQPLDIAIKKGFPKVIKPLGNLYEIYGSGLTLCI